MTLDHHNTDSDAILRLLRLAASIADADDDKIRRECQAVLTGSVPTLWVEELLLQSLLMVGWPATLNAAAVWRGQAGPLTDTADQLDRSPDTGETRRLGEATCQIIYGRNYSQLRKNVAALHPLLDDWMIRDGYGKTLSRPGLSLKLRELCTVAQCAVLGARRQLHSHLKGALNAGASHDEIMVALAAAKEFQDPESVESTLELWQRIIG